MLKPLALGTAVLLFALPANAGGAPRVVADIAPVHSLVAQVMEGIATPDLIVPPGVSPHSFTLRPSTATALQQADAVFWVGETLTPWLHGPVETLATSAMSVELLESPGTKLLSFRETPEHDEEGHKDDAHDEHAHEDDGHEDEDGHDDHNHEGTDPHAWLDPENAKNWLGIIAAQLTQIDPDNGAKYAANAAAGQAKIDAAMAQVEAALHPVHEKPFIVFHDAYQYFETRFDLHNAGAIKLNDAMASSPARLQELREHILEENVACVFTEPQFSGKLVDTLIGGTTVASTQLDPLGLAQEEGAARYPALLVEMAQSIAKCLSGESD